MLRVVLLFSYDWEQQVGHSLDLHFEFAIANRLIERLKHSKQYKNSKLLCHNAVEPKCIL